MGSARLLELDIELVDLFLKLCLLLVFLASSCLKHTSDLSLNTWKSAVACWISSDRALLRFLLCITVITMTMKPATMTALKITELQVLSPMINVWYYSEIKVKMSVDVDTPVCNPM